MFRKALIISAAIHLSLVGIYVASQLYHPKDEVEYTVDIIRQFFA